VTPRGGRFFFLFPLGGRRFRKVVGLRLEIFWSSPLGQKFCGGVPPPPPPPLGTPPPRFGVSVNGNLFPWRPVGDTNDGGFFPAPRPGTPLWFFCFSPQKRGGFFTGFPSSLGDFGQSNQKVLLFGKPKTFLLVRPGVSPPPPFWGGLGVVVVWWNSMVGSVCMGLIWWFPPCCPPPQTIRISKTVPFWRWGGGCPHRLPAFPPPFFFRNFFFWFPLWPRREGPMGA